MTILQSIILALVEGLTEFLPVSSTGHMILTEGILGMESTAYLKAFTVMIQLGAILSVVVYYFRRFLPFPIFGLKPDPTTSLGGWRLYGLMIIGCIPAAILGALFNDTIDDLLGNTWVVLTMLFLGGILMIYFDRIPPKIVAIERETPGTIARHWKSPMMKAFCVVTLRSVLPVKMRSDDHRLYPSCHPRCPLQRHHR